MVTSGFFSRRAGVVVGVLLLLALLWTVYNLGGTALNRWFG